MSIVRKEATMSYEPTTIDETISLLRTIDIIDIDFIRRKDDKDPFYFMDSIGMTNHDDGRLMVKHLQKSECIRPYAQDDDLSRPSHVWIFVHSYHTNPCDPPIPIYIKLRFEESKIAVVISFHKDKKP